MSTATATANALGKVPATKASINRVLMPEAVARRRQEMVSAARREFEAAIPRAQTDLGAARADFKAVAFRKTADELALATGLQDLLGRKVVASQAFAWVILKANEAKLRVVVALSDGLNRVKGSPEGPEAAQALQ